MIRFLSHEQIDKTKWDACITASADNMVYALSWFLDVVSAGWQAFVEEQEGTYVTVMPLPGILKMGFPYLSQPYHTHQLGVFTTARSSEGVREQMLERTLKHYKFIHSYRFNMSDTAHLEKLQDTYELVARYTRYLKLNKPYPELYKNYTRDRKMNLKRAKRANLSMFESDDIEPLIQHFKKHIEHKVVGGVSEHTYQMLRDLFGVMKERGVAQLIYTTSGDEVNAGCLFFKYNNVISYAFNSADSEGRVANGRTLVLDEIIRQHAGTDYTLDFESPMIEQIEHFYASFGAHRVKYFALRHNALPLYVKIIRNIRMKVYRTFFSTGVAEEV
ncbi:GNAT family N-acetyltransferase [Pontibacter anaerobius]|uniref:GNAT family N-acetyltransferase n=1 Tax=Pontibacter anaerobius TaxID=2993940 RepID=A0ABT3RL23_9BACT|nr:GNAT family N-acetyltransferase [Pontibacter anaerobius]MCX2742078.1 GNAT family N-acetyltransferase [Pontibacter anaerobius]